MWLLDLTLPTLPENLALDEALLLAAEKQGGEVLRFWEWPQPAVVLGAAGRLSEEVDEAACQAADVPICRRASGGGTVLLGSGCLIFSLVLAFDRSPLLRSIRSSYQFILEIVGDALQDVVPGLELAGISDLAVSGRKFSGNSQQRKSSHLLHHGTLLYAFDLASVSHYLRLPTRQPAYRQGRSHADFLMNVPVDLLGLKRRLRSAWQAEEPAPSWPAAEVGRLVEQKYSRSKWSKRR
jgi:lipoate-protein ligase A